MKFSWPGTYRMAAQNTLNLAINRIRQAGQSTIMNTCLGHIWPNSEVSLERRYQTQII